MHFGYKSSANYDMHISAHLLLIHPMAQHSNNNNNNPGFSEPEHYANIIRPIKSHFGSHTFPIITPVLKLPYYEIPQYFRILTDPIR